MKKSKILLLFVPVIIVFAAFEYKTDRFEVVKNIDIFTEVYKQVVALYVDETQPGELMQTGIDAMLSSLDPYTVFYPESDIEDYKMMTTGQYGGIGARIRSIDEYVVIDEPYEGFAAHKAGLRAGDVILEVDGKDVKGKSTSDLSTILKGNPGTLINLKIAKTNGDTNNISFKREEVKISSVPYHGMLDDKIGYIKMTSFTRNVSDEIKESFNDLKRNNNMESLVLDLRNNPGGLLHEAIEVVNLFVSKNIKVVETRGRVEEWMKAYKTMSQPLDDEIKVVVLVNGGSASASEIVSGALQDLDRAIVVGGNTYGKGLVQTTRNLKYNTSIKVTTAKYYIPSGRCIQAIDYSNKDKNGKAKKIPDSLFASFTTLNGRIVEDGHGIQPDVEVDNEKISDVTQALMKQNLIFHFATNYTLQNDSISAAKDFKLVDKDFKEFMKFVKSRNFEYESNTDKKMQALKEAAEEEKFTEVIDQQIKALEKKLAQQEEDELLKNKEEILRFLQSEIVSRYYFQKGKIENGLVDDPYLIEAMNYLNDISAYNEILLPSNNTVDTSK
jgi:carboxyl-terminal processing protease